MKIKFLVFSLKIPNILMKIEKLTLGILVLVDTVVLAGIGVLEVVVLEQGKLGTAVVV
jgi:hypothetical protein